MHMILYWVAVLVAVAWAVPAGPEMKSEVLDTITETSAEDNAGPLVSVTVNDKGFPSITPLNKVAEEMQIANRSGRELSSNELIAGTGESRLLGLINLPNSPQCVYQTNCNFIGLDLYVAVNILSALQCGNVVCGGDSKCTHFVYNPILNGGTCYLKGAPNSGGGWYTPTPPSSGLTCGHIPKRSCGAGSLISLCLGLSLNIL